MKVHIVAVGRVKESYFADGIAEYVKRLSRFCKIDITEIKEENFTEDPSSSEIEKICKKEGESILRHCRGRVIALCIEGTPCDSAGFSEKIARARDTAGEITFVIGGSYGLSPEVKARADEKFSFSKMTFPHTLARLMLVEQIYRGFMIDAGSAYHK